MTENMRSSATAIPGPAYRIVTPRLVLRCWNPSDAALLKAAVDVNIEYLLPWLNWAMNEPTDLQAKIDLTRHWRARFDRGEDFVYGVFNVDESSVLGSTGLHTRLSGNAREIGYWIHKDFSGRGLATELAAALTKVAFEVDKVERVEIHCDERNLPSAAVARKLGYTHEATLRHREQDYQSTWRSSMIWSLLASEYPSSPSAIASITVYDAAGRRIM